MCIVSIRSSQWNKVLLSSSIFIKSKLLPVFKTSVNTMKILVDPFLPLPTDTVFDYRGTPVLSSRTLLLYFAFTEKILSVVVRVFVPVLLLYH